MTDDELDNLLMPPSPQSNEPRRDAIFAKTLPFLQPRRFGKWLAALALFAAGLALGWFAKPTPPPERIVETVIEKVPVPAEVPPSVAPAVELAADRLELEAEKATDPIESAKFYQRAGDAYLKANDVTSAIRCYRQYLAEAGPDGRTVRMDDSWLLTSIKNSRKETEHANAGS